MASLNSMINVLGKFYPEFLGDEDWADFYAVNDVGLPLAVALLNDVATLANDGEEVLVSTWKAFCARVGIDPESEYDDLEDVWDESDEDDD